jgi:hypothetical protein
MEGAGAWARAARDLPDHHLSLDVLIRAIRGAAGDDLITRTDQNAKTSPGIADSAVSADR